MIILFRQQQQNGQANILDRSILHGRNVAPLRLRLLFHIQLFEHSRLFHCPDPDRDEPSRLHKVRQEAPVDDG